MRCGAAFMVRTSPSSSERVTGNETVGGDADGDSCDAAGVPRFAHPLSATPNATRATAVLRTCMTLSFRSAATPWTTKAPGSRRRLHVPEVASLFARRARPYLPGGRSPDFRLGLF